MHQECLAKRTVAQEIGQLFALQDLGCHLVERIRDRGRQTPDLHHAELRFGEKGEVVASCSGRELMKKKRFVEFFEMIVQHIAVGGAAQLLCL